MSTPGKVVARSSGRRGLLSTGKAAVFNAAGGCSRCCVGVVCGFTDTGFINGGQDGAYRAYNHPSQVPASPWTVFGPAVGMRLDWEDDNNCREHNPYTQYATAECQITVDEPTIMTILWSGMGETEDANYELMELYVDEELAGSAHAPGGDLGCDGGMAPVVSDPPPPQEVLLTSGTHPLFITATTNDELYHFGAWYQFELAFRAAS